MTPFEQGVKVAQALGAVHLTPEQADLACRLLKEPYR